MTTSRLSDVQRRAAPASLPLTSVSLPLGTSASLPLGTSASLSLGVPAIGFGGAAS